MVTTDSYYFLPNDHRMSSWSVRLSQQGLPGSSALRFLERHPLDLQRRRLHRMGGSSVPKKENENKRYNENLELTRFTYSRTLSSALRAGRDSETD